MKFTFRHLEAFDAVASFGSITKAAEQLNISQSAVSAALTDLQLVLGQSLFVHGKGRRLQITEEGRKLRPRVRLLLTEAQEIGGASDAPLMGTLNIGASALIAETVLPDLCVRFMGQHPDVKIKVQSATAGELWEKLSRLELETALIEHFPEIEELKLVPWRSDELWLVTAPSHPLAQRRDLSLAELAGMQWYLREAHSSIVSRLRILTHEALGQLDTRFVATSNAAVRLAAIAGGGITCLPRQLVEADISRGALVRLDVSDFKFTRNLSIAYPAEMRRSRAATQFEAFLLANGDFK